MIGSAGRVFAFLFRWLAKTGGILEGLTHSRKNKSLESGVNLGFFCVGSKDVLKIPSFIPFLGA
jgi:hypothetical protein